MKNAIKTAGFLMGVFAIFILITLLFSDKPGQKIYNKTAVAKKIGAIDKLKDNTMDVIFVGDSICYSSFSPNILKEKFNLNSYVCATSAQRLCDSYAILNDVLETQSPKFVVLESNALYRQMTTDVNEKDIVLKLLAKHTPLVDNHSDWKYDIAKLLNNTDKIETDLGFVAKYNISPFNGGEYMIPTKESDEFFDYNKEYLTLIKELCDRKGAQLLIVSSLSPKNWNYKRHNAVDKWCSENDVLFFDLNLYEEVGIDWNLDTNDSGDHLNVYGAEKVSLYFGKIITEININN